MSIGVPIKVLHEAEGHIVTCETNTGEVYRGKLIEAEDKKKPCSDETLCRLLQEQYHIPISRRTINKYRLEMNIPDRSGRRVWE